LNGSESYSEQSQGFIEVKEKDRWYPREGGGAARAMSQKRIVVFHPSPGDAERLSGPVSVFGQVEVWTDLQDLAGRLGGKPIGVAILGPGFGRHSLYRDLLSPSTSIILTGLDESELRRTADEWPPSFFVEVFVGGPDTARERSFLLAFERALAHARLKSETEELRRTLAQHEAKVRDVYTEIQEIKGLINSNVLLEIEKRIAIETKYVWFQKERQRTEAILRRIYAADDISSLLDILPDIRDIVKAAGATVYIIEENDLLGRYLKPIIWDNFYLPHADFAKYIALWDAQDFAASVARYGQGINVADLSFDRRLTARYAERLRSPLKNLLAVPIMHNRKVIGVVEVYNKTVGGRTCAEGFSRDDQDILQGISEHMAIAVMKLNLIQYDALTGLLRPDPFFEKVLQKINALGKRRREEGDVAMVMGDVDWFKNYNDRNGHEAGNRLLRELAHVLKLSIREEDLLCRYGGEEFLIFLTGVKGAEEAALLTERIRKNVEDHYFEFQEFQPQNNLTMSFGVTVLFRDTAGQTPVLTKADLKRLAMEADSAMAEAKGKRRPDLKMLPEPVNGRIKNRVSIYAPEAPAVDGRGDDGRASREATRRERRKHERTNASTLLMIKKGGEYQVTNTVNLGVGGARIVSDMRLTMAETMDAILVLGDKASFIRGDVVYSEKPDKESGFFYTGLRFRGLSSGDIRSLEEYLQQFRRKYVTNS